jgi:hypothetical protein
MACGVGLTAPPPATLLKAVPPLKTTSAGDQGRGVCGTAVELSETGGAPPILLRGVVREAV